MNVDLISEVINIIINININLLYILYCIKEVYLYKSIHL